jgi:hypothetical protein
MHLIEAERNLQVHCTQACNAPVKHLFKQPLINRRALQVRH